MKSRVDGALLGVAHGLAAGCGGGTSARPDADQSADAAAPIHGGGVCIPTGALHGITALDTHGRVLNARGIHLVDWDGFLANPAETIKLRPPADVAFPAQATITADHPRLYFNLPSATAANGRASSCGSTAPRARSPFD